VVLDGQVDLRQFWEAFAPLQLQGDPAIQVQQCLLSNDERLALLPSLTVDRGRPQRFLVAVHRRDDGQITVGVSPITDPERTLGVKRTVALVAEAVQRQFSEACVSSTNLGPFLCP